MKRRLDPAEREPCGTPGLRALCNRSFQFKEMADDLSDCLATRTKPHLIVIWEPLPTKTPAPPKARPYCCYAQTVIFYHYPYIPKIWRGAWRTREGLLRRQSAGFEEWDRLDYRLAWDNVVEFEDERFVVGGGAVVWKRRNWWMIHTARRETPR